MPFLLLEPYQYNHEWLHSFGTCLVAEVIRPIAQLLEMAQMMDGYTGPKDLLEAWAASIHDATGFQIYFEQKDNFLDARLKTGLCILLVTDHWETLIPDCVFTANVHPRLPLLGKVLRSWLKDVVIPSRAIWLAETLEQQDAAFADFYATICASHEFLVETMDMNRRGDVLTYVLDNLRGNLAENIRECQKKERLFRREDGTAGESVHWWQRVSAGNCAGANSSRLLRDGGMGQLLSLSILIRRMDYYMRTLKEETSSNMDANIRYLAAQKRRLKRQKKRLEARGGDTKDDDDDDEERFDPEELGGRAADGPVGAAPDAELDAIVGSPLSVFEDMVDWDEVEDAYKSGARRALEDSEGSLCLEDVVAAAVDPAVETLEDRVCVFLPVPVGLKAWVVEVKSLVLSGVQARNNPRTLRALTSQIYVLQEVVLRHVRDAAARAADELAADEPSQDSRDIQFNSRGGGDSTATKPAKFYIDVDEFSRGAVAVDEDQSAKPIGSGESPRLGISLRLGQLEVRFEEAALVVDLVSVYACAVARDVEGGTVTVKLCLVEPIRLKVTTRCLSTRTRPMRPMHR